MTLNCEHLPIHDLCLRSAMNPDAHCGEKTEKGETSYELNDTNVATNHKNLYRDNDLL